MDELVEKINDIISFEVFVIGDDEYSYVGGSRTAAERVVEYFRSRGFVE